MDDTRLIELAGLAAGESYGPDNNPLDRDDLAFRLAVKLFLWQAVRDGDQHIDSDNDFYAATRRAIVCAAAALQKTS